MDKYIFIDNTFLMILSVVVIPLTIHFIKVFSKKPYKSKILPISIFFLLLITNLTFGFITDHNDYKKVVNAEVDSEITNIRRTKNAKRYWLKNDMVMKLNSPYSVDLQLKDLIVKDSNSNHLRVYRLDNNRKYALQCTFDY